MGSPPLDLEVPQQAETHPLAYWEVVLRRWRIVLAVFVLVGAAAAVRTHLQRSVYRATVQILIEPEMPNVLSFKDVSEANAARQDYYQTQYKLLQSRSLARKVVESLQLLQHPEFGGPRNPADVEAALASKPGESPLMESGIDGVLGRLIVAPLKDSQLVMVSYESFSPDLAARVANELSRKYIEQTLEFRYQISSETSQWLEGQIADQRKKVQGAELKLQKVREEDGVGAIEERRALLGQKLASLGQTLNELKADRLQKEALYQQMRQAPNPEDLAEVLSNPVIQSLRSDLNTQERELAALLERYLDQHPAVIKVREQILETRKRLSAESQRVIRSKENDFKAAAAQEASIAREIERVKTEIHDLSQRALNYDTVKRERDANMEILNGLISRVKQTDVAGELKSSNIRIVDPAVVPRGPVRPNRIQDTVKGMLMGLALGLLLAFGLEYLDNTLKTPDDVRKHLGAPLLGVIAENQAKSPGPVLLGPRPMGAFAEGYRVVRTSLNYCWPEAGSRVLAVTSTAPGEGKTLTSANLALTLSSGDGRVLLIDADLRKSQGHVLLNAQRRPGLSDVLVGQAKPSEAVQAIRGTNLSFLAAGTRTPSPADLMTSPALEGLLGGLRGLYNWIIIDTPPVAAVADTLIITRATDGVLIVVGAEMVPRGGVRQTLERVAETGARILGVVLNRAQTHRYGYYYGYYGHYYSRYYGHYQQDAQPKKVTPIRRGSR
jgi:capsular exopolysaccharide synthesis family protein